MDDVASAAAIVLAVLFAYAGIAKLLHPAETAASFAALELPASGALARVVPLVEIGLAALLVTAPAIGGSTGAVLLVAFTVVLLRAIARGVAAPCSCFGSSRREPVSSVEVVRNAMLAALAVIATAASGAAGWPGLPALVIVTVGVALARVVLAVLELRRGGGRLWPSVPGEQR